MVVGVSAYFYIGQSASLCMIYPTPTRRGIQYSVDSALFLSSGRLATDSIGIVDLTLSGLIAGTEVNLYTLTGTLLYNNESASANQVVTVDFYSAGSASNDVYFVLLKPGLEYMKIFYTLTPTDTAIPVQQRVDRSYLNP